MTVVLTGFGKFKKHKVNPSEIIAMKLNHDTVLGEEIVSYSIPVSYRKVIKTIPEIILNHEPIVFIGMGLAGGRPNITLERVAINVMDTESPDVDGFAPSDQRIFDDGENAYFSTLPLKKLIKKLRENRIPAMISNSAGTYVCNTLMYTSLYTISKHGLSTLAGFIHLPFLPEQVLDKQQPSMSLDMMIKAIRLVIEETLLSLDHL